MDTDTAPAQTSKRVGSIKDIVNSDKTNTGNKVAHHEPGYPQDPMLLEQSSS